MLVSVLKSALSTVGIAGVFTLGVGLGVLPLDENMVAVANVFIEPVGVPVKPFFIFLGSCQILGAASLWGIGPMPNLMGRLGLMLAASCGAYGHAKNGESFVPAASYVFFMGILFFLDEGQKKKKKSA
mmetsp:Transcript_32098/g.47228  ORF Transcript_32098/g.47228 Transcript_32098/m.47228 type:complete len:128 (+) Transcript_32098:183-566(+)